VAALPITIQAARNPSSTSKLYSTNLELVIEWAEARRGPELTADVVNADPCKIPRAYRILVRRDLVAK